MFEPARYLVIANDGEANIVRIHSEEQLNVLFALRHQLLIHGFEKIEVKNNG